MLKKPISIVGYLSIVTVLTLFLFSCKKSTDSPETDSTKQGTVYEYIKKLGFKESDVKDIGDNYLVEGDILFSKKSKPDFSIFNRAKTEQYGMATYVGYYKQYDVQIAVDYSLQNFLTEIQEAADMWNDIPNCRIWFQINQTLPGQSPSGDIKMTPLPLGYPLEEDCGTSFFPMNGLAAEYIYINVNAVSSYSPAQRRRTFAHMMGHAIGFRHNNWQGQEIQSDGYNWDSQHILGTPTGIDPNSIMNRAECGFGPTTFSAYDIIAAEFIYPDNPPVAGTVPVFCYYDRQQYQKHFYTTDWTELFGGSSDHYQFKGIAFFAFPNQVANSVPVHRWYIPGTYEHFYSTDPNEIPLGGTYEGVGFYAYPSAINGAVPVHRYYSRSPYDHFYTKNQNEVTYMPGYGYEFISWYAY